MSDEMMIQPQVQPRRDNTPLYAGAGIGAVAGAGAGYYAAPKIGSKPMSHDDIVAEVNDKDKFESRTKEGAEEAATWKDVKAKADEVKAADDALTEAKKPKADPNHADVKNYNTAVENRRSAYDALVKKETDRLTNAAANGIGIDGINPRDPQFLKASEVPNPAYFYKEPNPNLLDKFVYGLLGQNKKEYTDMTRAVTKASQDVTSAIGAYGQPLSEYNRLLGDMRPGATNPTSNLKGLFDHFVSGYNAAPANLKADFFNPSVVENYVPKDSPIFGEAMNMARILHPDVSIPTTTPTYTLHRVAEIDHYFKMGGEYVDAKNMSTVQPGQSAVRVQYYDPSTGKHRDGFIKFDVAKRDSYINELNATLGETRRKEALSILEKAKEYAQLLETNSEANINESLRWVDKNVGIAMGYTDNAGTSMFTEGNGAKINEIINESHGTKTITKNGVTYTGYENDIERLKSTKSKTLPKDLNGKYFKKVLSGGTTTYVECTTKEALDMAQARQSLITERATILRDFNQRYNAIFNELPKMSELNTQIQSAYANDEALNKAIAELRARFPQLFKEGSAAGLSADEIAKLAKEYADKNIDPKLQAEIDRLKPLFDKANEGGKVDDAAVKAATENKTKLENELKELTTKLGEKFKTGGMNKWAGLAIGAAALAAAGAGIGSLFSKDEA